MEETSGGGPDAAAVNVVPVTTGKATGVAERLADLIPYTVLIVLIIFLSNFEISLFFAKSGQKRTKADTFFIPTFLKRTKADKKRTNSSLSRTNSSLSRTNSSLPDYTDASYA